MCIQKRYDKKEFLNVKFNTLNWSINKKEYILLSALVVLFIIFHLWGVSIPYHQDEYKWVYYSHPELVPAGTVPHPPLTEFIYTKIGPIVGDSNFRFIPFAFGFVNLFLLFYLAKIIFDKKTAFWTAFLFVISFYSLLATLMVDVDGAVMPFFFLILSIGYFKCKELGWKNWKWIILLFIGAVGGFLIKVSTVLPLVAIALDFAIEKKVFSDKKRLLEYSLSILGVILFLILVLLGAKYIFPFFNLKYALGYWEHFWTGSSFLNRGWFQTFIQFAKSILYSSPLLLAPVFFMDKDIFKKTRAFFLFIFLGLFFYLFAFDFSLGALDRYLQFLVIPLCLISGAIFAKYFAKPEKKSILIAIIISLGIFLLQFVKHFTPPLYPKTEWIHRLVSLKWNFLYPFSGGSGPLAFYISFAFMALIWITCIFFALIFLKKREFKKELLFCILILGLLYNAVFIEEYLFGKINGSARTLVHDVALFIKNNKDIKKVTVYNDNGGFNVQQTGKYRKRLYIDPKFDINEKMATLNQYKEHYLVIDIPHIDPNTIYARYFNSCQVIFEKISGSISSKIYDCTKAPNIK